MSKYVLSCESTVDLPYEYIHQRGIEVLFYTYNVNGEEYIDDMGRNKEALPKFYSFLDAGNIPSTSQINEYKYYKYFKDLLSKGVNILHIAFGSGMTQSVIQARLAAEELQDEFPNQDIIVIDSLCSSSGYGMLVDDVKDMMDLDISIPDIVRWIEENKNKIHHQFFSTDLKYYRRSGRMSGPVATIATFFRICPIMRLNAEGRIIAYDKVMGRKNAIKRTVDTMEEHCDKGKDYDEKCWICHSRQLNDALETKKALIERFPKIKGEIKILDIGTIIASHCGPGTVAVFFHGDERKE